MNNNSLEKLVKGMYGEMLKLDDKAYKLTAYAIHKPNTKKAFMFHTYSAQAAIIENTLIKQVKKKDWLKKEVNHNYVSKTDSWKETKSYWLPRFHTGTAQVKTPDEFWSEYKDVI